MDAEPGTPPERYLDLHVEISEAIQFSSELRSERRVAALTWSKLKSLALAGCASLGDAGRGAQAHLS